MFKLPLSKNVFDIEILHLGGIQKPHGSLGGRGVKKVPEKNTLTYMNRTTQGGGGSKNPKNRTTRFLDAP